MTWLSEGIYASCSIQIFLRKIKMQKIKNRIVTIVIAIFLMISMSASMMLMPNVNAHTPVWQIPTFAQISVAPDPVGVGQTVAVYMFLGNAPVPGSAVTNTYRFHNYKLTITAPDGTTTSQTWDTIQDTTNNQGTTFIPNQVGTYTLTFTYPGQTLTAPNDQPASTNGATSYVNDTYLPSSASTALTVQQDPIPAAITGYPLPTEYWARPIEGQNTNWYTIGSNYLSPFAAAYSFGSVRLQPDGTAPNSGHVMWTKPIQFGGVVGGTNTGDNGSTFYTGLSYETRFNNPIIIYGRLYYPLPRGNNGAGNGYVCVDLRTGEQLWWQNYTISPSFASLEWFDSPNQHGVIPNGYLWITSGTTWMAYDAWDGNWLFNVTGVPSGTRVLGPNGEILLYQLDATNKWLALWNITYAISHYSLLYGGEGYRPVGANINASATGGYSWNVTIPTLPSGSIRWVIYDDILLGSTATTFGGIGTATSNLYNTVWAISLKPASLGTLLWTKDIPAPAGNVTALLGTVDPLNRVFLISTKETMQWYGYNLDTGTLLWGPIGKTRAFNYYPTIGSGGTSQIGYVAYGSFYVGGYGGEIFCYDTKTGDLQWKYNDTNSGFQTPWGLYPTFIGAIADGKVYVYNGEHSPNSPLYKGESVTCLNATTGERIWILDAWVSVGGFADQGIPVADGYIAYFNSYDGQVYSIGQGPSAMTVSAPDVAVSLGTPVVIRGTVTDIAAGTKQDEQAARFPNGVPAVSDASQSAWMEYVYMQKPMPTSATGVPVAIDVVDSNGNYRNIGTTTSDSSGMFTFTWTPDITGSYRVIATFAGSNSYFGSSAETSFYASAAPPTPSPYPVTTLPPTEMYFAASTAAIIIAIAVAVLLLRKRP
jgi:outer membrane protein assembly factor BamB